jgi:hypothetical protein
MKHMKDMKTGTRETWAELISIPIGCSIRRQFPGMGGTGREPALSKARDRHPTGARRLPERFAYGANSRSRDGWEAKHMAPSLQFRWRICLHDPGRATRGPPACRLLPPPVTGSLEGAALRRRLASESHGAERGSNHEAHEGHEDGETLGDAVNAFFLLFMPFMVSLYGPPWRSLRPSRVRRSPTSGGGCSNSPSHFPW